MITRHGRPFSLPAHRLVRSSTGEPVQLRTTSSWESSSPQVSWLGYLKRKAGSGRCPGPAVDAGAATPASGSHCELELTAQE